VTRAEFQRRRSRALVIVAAAFAAIVLLTSFPITALLAQRDQVSATQSQEDQLTAQNRLLSNEASRLKSPAVVAAIARADFGFVKAGEKAYDILPTPATSATSAITSGHLPLNGQPVAPGSAQSQLLLDPGVGAATAPGPSHTRPKGTGLWDRIAHVIEFWR